MKRCTLCGGEWFSNEGHDDTYEYHEPGCPARVVPPRTTRIADVRMATYPGSDPT